MEIDEKVPGNQSQQDVTRTTDNETGHDPRRDEPKIPLSPDDEAPVEEDMSDVEAANSVASEHPESGSEHGTADGENLSGEKESRNEPASDPEAGA